MRDCIQFLVAADTHQVRGRLHSGITIRTINLVAKIDKTVAAMRNTPQNTSYNDLLAVCIHFFGQPRQSGTSHAVFKTP